MTTPGNPSVRILGTATRELANDVLAITFTKVATGKDPIAVQDELRDAINAAIVVIQPVRKEGEIDVETSAFHVTPTYTTGSKPKLNGYHGSADIIVKGTDTAGISKLASELKTVVVSSATNSLSRKAREAAEASLTAEAIEDFKVKADAVTKGFSYKKWELSDVTVNTSNPRGGYGKVMALGASAGFEAAPMQVESGKSEMTATVQGNILLKK